MLCARVSRAGWWRNAFVEFAFAIPGGGVRNLRDAGGFYGTDGADAARHVLALAVYRGHNVHCGKERRLYCLRDVFDHAFSVGHANSHLLQSNCVHFVHCDAGRSRRTRVQNDAVAR